MWCATFEDVKTQLCLLERINGLYIEYVYIYMRTYMWLLIIITYSLHTCIHTMLHITYYMYTSKYTYTYALICACVCIRLSHVRMMIDVFPPLNIDRYDNSLRQVIPPRCCGLSSRRWAGCGWQRGGDLWAHEYFSRGALCRRLSRCFKHVVPSGNLR